MARISKYKNRKRAQLVLEADLHSFAVKRATEFRLPGGFCEYVARLIALDKTRKGVALARRAA